MAGRGRGLEMTKPAWMTEVGGGSAPGTSQHTDSGSQSTTGMPPGIGFVGSARGSSSTQQESDWSEHTAPNGRKYFFNRRTKESRWEKPPELVAAALAEEAQNWKEFMSPDGRKYYYNKVTRESKWTLPDEILAAKAAVAAKSTTPAAPVQVVKLSETKKEKTVSTGAGASRSKASAAKTETVSEKTSAALEEGRKAFRELLESVNCKPGWSWDQVMRATVTDSRYGALSTLAEKKACFREYIDEMEREREEKEKERAKIATDQFIQLLDENSDVTYSTRYLKAKELIGHDERWDALDDFHREATFIRHLRQKRDDLVERRKENRDENIVAFKGLLKKYNIKMTTPYRRACNKLQGLDDFEALGRLDRLEVFESYIRDLERKYYEEEEAEEAAQRRQDRKSREAFKELLKKHVEEGIVNAKSRWKEYYEAHHKEEAIVAMDKTKFGSRPRELFEDVIEKLEEEYDKNRAIMKDVYRTLSIVVTPSDTLEKVKEVMEKGDERMKEINFQNLKIIFNELHSKACDKEARELKRRKRAKEDFLSHLKRSQNISETTTWEEAKLFFADRLDPKYEQDYEEVWQEFLAKLRRKEERRKKKESLVESSSGEEPRHRRVNRHRKRRGGSSESEEGAIDKRSRSKRYYSDEEMEGERQSKKHKREKHRERKRDRHEKEKSKSKHDSHRKKNRKARSISPSASLSTDRYKQEELASPIFHDEDPEVSPSNKQQPSAPHDGEGGSVEEGEARVQSAEEGEAIESATEEGEV